MSNDDPNLANKGKKKCSKSQSKNSSRPQRPISKERIDQPSEKKPVVFTDELRTQM